MAISGHKSLQSLALCTRVHDDEKLLMGLKLTYSLLKPEEARELREIADESEPEQKKMKEILPKPSTVPDAQSKPNEEIIQQSV